MDIDPNSIRRLLLDHGMNPETTKTLNDIIHTNVSSVVRDMTADDVRFIAQFISEGENEDKAGEITEGGTKQRIKSFLELNPAFRSRNPEKICLYFSYYYKSRFSGIQPTYSLQNLPLPILPQDFQQMMVRDNQQSADVQQLPPQQPAPPPPQPQNPQSQNSTRSTTPTTTPTNSSTSISLPNRPSQRK